MYSISNRFPNYTSPAWAVFEYVALFGIVLMHEFGHALACRQVGGKADQIVLWPLGGVAYAAPPARPGATLWSIAAGLLVNVLLLPITIGALYVAIHGGVERPSPDPFNFIKAVVVINISLLVFNLLPVYPLDGGQIFRSLLWYPFGKARSLLVATALGLAGGAALVGVAVWQRSIWIGIMALFMVSNCWRSFNQAKAMRALERLPRRANLMCPSCNVPPPIAKFWLCQKCRQPFDLFADLGVCPSCGTE